jgi:hypothetical protein
MNTKLLMTFSAVVLGVAGLILSFVPEEVASYINATGAGAIALQMLGAVFIGFAMLNWTAKANLIGGIYSKPVAIANFTHFTIGALALVKLLIKNTNPTYLLVASLVYSILALLFGYILFSGPSFKKKLP